MQACRQASEGLTEREKREETRGEGRREGGREGGREGKRGERGRERARGETISTIARVVVRKDTGSKLGNHAAWGHLDGAPNWRVDLDENPGATQLWFRTPLELSRFWVQGSAGL